MVTFDALLPTLLARSAYLQPRMASQTTISQTLLGARREVSANRAVLRFIRLALGVGSLVKSQFASSSGEDYVKRRF
jgi:hypothetical protein